jgi:hypothetical protein
MPKQKLETFIRIPHATPRGTPTMLKDARATFRKLTNKRKPDAKFEQAFVRHRHHIAMTHPLISAEQRRSATRSLSTSSPALSPSPEAPPIPGGIGYGMYYVDPFRTAFTEGTGIYWDIVCPPTAGGNVSDYLYITAMNRASLGVEAFVRYHGADEPGFLIFDWSLDEGSRLQPEVKFSALADYLRPESVHDATYQILPVMNMTFLNDDASWTNQAWFLNHITNHWDLAYQQSYAANATAQHDDFIGSWGPIVETFQDSYNGTNPMGALNTQLSTHLNGQWGAWSNLRPADSAPRVDNKGFLPVFIDANSSWVIRS